MQTGSVRIFGSGRIGIYANSPAANTTFYLARVLPGAQGRTLVLSFFDVGDAAQAGAITVLPPTDSNQGGAFAGCTFTAPPGNSTGPPWGAFQATSSGCKITNVSSANYNGQWIQVRIPIPSTYSCTYTDPLGCWLKVNFAFPAAVQDTTTWTAQLTGRPGPPHPVGDQTVQIVATARFAGLRTEIIVSQSRIATIHARSVMSHCPSWREKWRT